MIEWYQYLLSGKTMKLNRQEISSTTNEKFHTIQKKELFQKQQKVPRNQR